MHGQGPTAFVGPPDVTNGSPKRTRKPYTSSKPREKWTDQEHELFVEALKLHGRQWSKVEEHIGKCASSQQDVWLAMPRAACSHLSLAGTKTVVQIRSHAQKFFQKQERDGDGESDLVSTASLANALISPHARSLGRNPA
jgi:SHAQKYF class myb-like DNA-binding protein